MESHCCELNNPDKKQMLIAGVGDMVDTPPMIPHAQKFLEDTVYLALSTQKRHDGKYEEDTTAFQVIEGYINPTLVKK